MIESIESPSDYADTLVALTASIIDTSEKNTRKQETNNLLEAIFSLVADPETSVQTKFYAVMVAKDLSLKKYPVFLSSLANSALLLQMCKLLRSVDPDKKEKGRSYGSDKVMGSKFMTLVSECIAKWAEKHPLTTNRTPSKFKVAYTELIADGVAMPKEFIYFQAGRRESREQTMGDFVLESSKSVDNSNKIGYESADEVFDKEN